MAECKYPGRCRDALRALWELVKRWIASLRLCHHEQPRESLPAPTLQRHRRGHQRLPLPKAAYTKAVRQLWIFGFDGLQPTIWGSADQDNLVNVCSSTLPTCRQYRQAECCSPPFPPGRQKNDAPILADEGHRAIITPRGWDGIAALAPAASIRKQPAQFFNSVRLSLSGARGGRFR